MKQGFLIFLLLSLLLGGGAQARSPILLGVSDTGRSSDYLSYTELIERRVPLLQTFHTWGTSLRLARLRWQGLGARPLLHISLTSEKTGLSLYSLRDIARGEGDDYLLRLNEEVRSWGQNIVIRPIAEPNRPLNSYSAYLSNGTSRGSEYSPYYYRRAFQRIALILRGGERELVNRKLARLSLAPIAYPGDLAASRAQIAWSPLPSSLGIRGNYPARFNPGKRFYDIVGTSFFSGWPEQKPLNRFYRKFSPGKRFYLLEWGLNSDRPRFVRSLYRWCSAKKRCRAMVYYQGFSEMDYRLENYPRSLLSVRNLSRDYSLYPLYTPEWSMEN